jgi:hypothetical protein
MLKIPEFKKAIEDRKNMQSIGESSTLVKAMANVFTQLENSGNTVKPLSFMAVIELFTRPS